MAVSPVSHVVVDYSPDRTDCVQLFNRQCSLYVLHALCSICTGDCVKVDLTSAWATLVLGQAKKATRTKGTRHNAVSDTPDTLCVEEKKRYSGE